MNIALVASGSPSDPGASGRFVRHLAPGLAKRGARVEVLTQDPGAEAWAPTASDGVVIRHFPTRAGLGQSTIAPGLRSYLREAAPSFDIVHAHCGHVSLALAVARARPRRLVFTPHVSIERMLRLSHARAARAAVDRAAETVCISHTEADRLRRALPWSAGRIRVVPYGVDAAAIQAAKPFPHVGPVVLVVGRLERHKRVDRAISALVALDPAYQLVVAGAGPALRSLQAYAADLEISSRVRFVGPVQEAEIYRWLRTAKVVVAVSEQETSGSLLLEAACAGVPVVASDIPAHREAAWLLDGVGTTLVSPQGSPLDVAEAVSLAEPLGVSWRARLRVPSWDAVVDSTLAIYEELVPHQRREAHAPGDFALSAPRQVNGSVLAFESRRSERS